MEGLRKLAGAYLVLVAVVVAGFFIINPFLTDTIEVQDVWDVLNVLMAVALALGLLFAFLGKRRVEAEQSSDGISRRYLEANVIFFSLVAVTVLFLHNWFSLLNGGRGSLEGNHQAWVLWAAVDTALPIVLGVLGCRLWRSG